MSFLNRIGVISKNRQTSKSKVSKAKTLLKKIKKSNIDNRRYPYGDRKYDKNIICPHCIA